MFRSSTIIRELAQNLAKVIFMLKHSEKLRRYLLCGCEAALKFYIFNQQIYFIF
jgi:tRNA U55 pseudouridine synthase TruB